MARLDMTSAASVLKLHYTDARLKSMTYKNNPLLAMLSKDTNVRGKGYIQPLIYGSPTSRSAGFATAQTNVAPSSYTDFSIPHVRNYGVASIDAMTIEAAATDRGAFLRTIKGEVDGILMQVTNDLANDLYRDGTGVRGFVAAADATIATGPNGGDVLTLGSACDTHAFEVGMELEYAATATGSVTALGTVLSLDRDAGTVEVDTGANPTATNTVDAYLFQAGDGQDGGATPLKAMGLAGYLTEGTPADLFGVVRSTDKERLSGVFYDGSAETLDVALRKGGARLSKHGGRPDVCLMNPLDLSDLMGILDDKSRFDRVKTDAADVSFDSIVIHTAAGAVRCVGDPWCQEGIAWMLQLDTWKLFSMGQAPGILMKDGNRILREAAADGYEVRTGYYANLACSAPGCNARIKLA